MKISAELETKLGALRLEGLMRYAAMESAEKAYLDAKAREKAACQYAAEHCVCKTKSGAPLTGENAMYELPEEDFSETFVPLMAEGYKELYGIEYAANYSPLYGEYYRPFLNAQKAYRRLAADFLRISGKSEEADTIERFLDSYCKPDFLERLDRINAQFLGISVE